jgi:hypothetical protein
MKTIIAPILAFIFIVLKAVFNIDFGTELEGQITDWAVTGAAIVLAAWGIIKNHFDKKESKL